MLTEVIPIWWLPGRDLVRGTELGYVRLSEWGGRLMALPWRATS